MMIFGTLPKYSKSPCRSVPDIRIGVLDKRGEQFVSCGSTFQIKAKRYCSLVANNFIIVI